MEDHIYSRSVTKEALSRRVVENQQIKASFTMAELDHLYRYDKPNFEERQQPILPEDDILKHLLNQYTDKIFKYHIHSSLLEDKPEDDLSEEEKLAAWIEDERECRRMEALNSNPAIISFGMPESEQANVSLNSEPHASTSNAIPPVRPNTSSAPMPASSLLDAD